jgi:hypothetical protein
MAAELVDLVRCGRYEELALWVKFELGEEVDPDVLRLNLGFRNLYEIDMRMWMKIRLSEMGYLSPGCKSEEGFGRLTVPMHMGWVTVCEEPEHLERLRNAHLSLSDRRDEEQQFPESLARSKVFTTAGMINPVNRVAARVAPEKELPEDVTERAALAVSRPREVARRGQFVRSTEGEKADVVGIRQCRRKGCPGVLLVARWPDGEQTTPCTAGMTFDGTDTWVIHGEETEPVPGPQGEDP